MKIQFLRPILFQPAVALVVALLMTSCATNQISSKQIQLTSLSTEKPIVAVLPFDNSKQYEEVKSSSAAPASLPVAKAVPGKPGFAYSPYRPTAGLVDVRGFSPNMQVKCPYTGAMFLVPGSAVASGKGGAPGDVKKFERNYFAARLIKSLRSNSAFKNAYFTTSVTPGVDFNVVGTVKKSDGKMTVIALTVKAADGKRIWSDTISVNTTSAQYRPKVDPSAVLWTEAATSIAKIPQKPGQFVASRVIGYGNNQAITVTDKRATMAGEAAAVERQQMLEPVTKKLLTYAPVAADKYLLWQKESVPLVEARSAEKVQTGINVGFQVLSVATMAAGAYSGNSFATQMAGQNMIQASNNIQVSAAKIKEINKTLLDAARAFDEYKGGSLTVSLFGKVYQLHGGLVQQQIEFRKIVAEQLAKVGG